MRVYTKHSIYEIRMTHGNQFEMERVSGRPDHPNAVKVGMKVTGPVLKVEIGKPIYMGDFHTSSVLCVDL